MVMYQSPAFHASVAPTKGCASCDMSTPVSTTSVMKSLPPLNAPRQRMRISIVLTNRKVLLPTLTPAYRLAAAPVRSSRCSR